jgi:hypothetical protein
MTPQAQLLAEIETFLATRDIAETTFGLRAVNDGKLVGRLRDGANMTLATVERVRAYMRAEAARDARVSQRDECVNGG